MSDEVIEEIASLEKAAKQHEREARKFKAEAKLKLSFYIENNIEKILDRAEYLYDWETEKKKHIEIGTRKKLSSSRLYPHRTFDGINGITKVDEKGVHVEFMRNMAIGGMSYWILPFSTDPEKDKKMLSEAKDKITRFHIKEIEND